MCPCSIVSISLVLLAQAPSPSDYANPEIGVSIRLPGEDWKLTDMSQGNASVLLFSPDPDFAMRCTILMLPGGLLPGGVLDRETQIKAVMGEAYSRASFAPAQLAGLEVERLEYTAKQHRTIEFGVKRGDDYFIFQLAAPDSAWADEQIKNRLLAITDSLTFTEPQARDAPVRALATPQEVQAKRARLHGPKDTPFELTHHRLTVEIDPAGGSLQSTDSLTIRSKQDDLERITLMFSGVSIDEVEAPGGATFEAHSGQARAGGWDGQLAITLKQPLASGRETTLTVRASRQDFFETIDQQLVQEIDVIGQIREASSFATHVGYYPIDSINDAAMDITLVVPAEYTAVTGGDLVSTEDRGAHKAFRYRTEVRVSRVLPFGFAVGKYTSVSTRSAGGLELTIYGYAGEEALLQQRAEVARDCADIFERMMGPLPWGTVRFAHVTPERKETGVSLPGLIVISDGYFTDFSEVDLSDGALNRPDALSLMVITDELSHQWNFYAVPLPNELAEGISTFTNVLFIEHRHGSEAYRRGIAFCRDAYFKAIMLGEDKAIADPAIYGSAAYRGVVFCKTPVILDMLRSQLGDEKFFQAWRKAFTQFDPTQDGFVILKDAFSEVGGRDLGDFFDQWFFTPGYPEIAVASEVADQQVHVTLTQKQAGRPFALDADLVIHGTAGETRKQLVRLRDRETIVTIPCDFAVSAVEFDPDDRVLKKVVD